jgi:hypothetical protein
MSKGRREKPKYGLPASEWVALFRKAGVQLDALESAKSHHARATLLGNFLAMNLGREVPIEVDGRMGTACLRSVDAGKRQRRYFFEVRWDGEPPADPGLDRDLGGTHAQSRNGFPIERPRGGAGRREKHRKAERTARPTVAPSPDRNGSGNNEEWS